MISTTIGSYTITEKLGEGGMGEVFVAHDSRLDRRVAIKFLPAPLSRDADFVARFEHEARAAAALNHPNIVTIHQLGEHDNRLFIVMELVQGQTLEELIKAGGLTLERSLDLALQVASGLQAAHGAGVVHRDIKPANILVDSTGRARILDFGLAKSRRATTQTQMGTTVGTVYYESPEQGSGRSVDARSDLFSLGSVLYEMIAGRRPFDGAFADAVRYAVSHDTPEPLARYAADVPQPVQQMVSRLLEKDPALRYQSAADLVAELKRFTLRATSGVSQAAAPGQVALVVLPFENRSADPEDEYFSDGLTEEVITDLANLEGIRVISRTSAMKLKGTQKDTRTLGRELDVQYVLSGSVRRSGNSLRVNAALVEADTDDQVWAQRFTGSMDDIFEIQEKVALATAEAVKVKLSPKEDANLKAHGIKNPQAYDLYLRARSATEQWTKPGLERARGYLDLALKLEPESPVLLAAMGYNYYNFVNTGIGQDDMLAEALRYTQEALKRDPESLDAHRLKGAIGLSLQGDVHTSLKSLRFVMSRAPEDTETGFWLALACSFVGQMEEARELSDRVMKLDPLNANSHITGAWISFMNGRYEEALAITRAGYDREPNMFATFTHAQALIHAGRWDELETMVGQIRSEIDSAPLFRLLLAQYHAYRGEREEMEALIVDDLLKTVNRDFQYPWQLAIAWLLLGEKEKALDLLEGAVTRGFWNYRFLGEYDPYLRVLHDHPRFVALLAKAKAAAERV